nr:putative late blight resistance protein homolog R1B-17 [Coffea arabica]
MKIEAKEIYDSIRFDSEIQRVTKTTINMPSQVTAPISNEVLVGLNDEVESIIDRLVSGPLQQDIVAIVGMSGLGKTTLANKVYSHLSVEYHFHIRAWCCFSQVYTKHSLLAQILCSINCGSSVQYLEMNEDDMAEKVYKLLKRNRYLIILDDVWDIMGWDLLKHSLPDDCNGSRILLTSRFQKLCWQIKPGSEPHHLRPLTEDESCELLQKKLFAKEDCPPVLGKVVMHVAKYCKGLPLTVVLVAGILATTEQDCWEEIVRRLTSSIYVDNEHCMKTLEQSYNYLPDYLKPCLLYFSAFKEDQDIPVRRCYGFGSLKNCSYPTLSFPREVVFLVHLRYLRIRNFLGNIPSAIASLSRLETFAVEGNPRRYLLPNTIWNIKTLRHLVTSEFGGGFIFPIDGLEGSPDLKHLDTLTLAIEAPPQNLQKILSKLPSIHNCQPWSKISAIGKLPNLVVLKLYRDSFLGEKWEMEEGDFCNLRFLKLSELDIRWWTASSGNFSYLEKLVLELLRLKEVLFRESVTLGLIKVISQSVVEILQQILPRNKWEIRA